jgi:hypothetical protein
MARPNGELSNDMRAQSCMLVSLLCRDDRSGFDRVPEDDRREVACM